MRPPFIAFACSLVAVAVGFATVPRPLEQVTMLIRDRRYEQALHLANAKVEAGEASPEVLMQAFLLNERYGDFYFAKSALRSYLALRPDDVEAWRKAAWVYANAHRREPLLNALENVLRLTGDPQTADRLARFYRMHARFDDELRVLQTIPSDKIGEARGMRLASLLAAEERLKEASALLADLDRILPIDARQPRMLLFEILVEDGRFVEAVEHASNWLETWHGAESRVEFVRSLLRAGAEEAAIQIASMADGSVEPFILDELISLLSSENRLYLLGDLLSGWIAQAVAISPEALDFQLREIVDVAAKRGMGMELALHLMRTLQRSERPDLQAGLINAILERFGYSAIVPVRAAITPQVLAARPVMAARLFLAEGNPMAARYFLLGTELADIPERLRPSWLDLAREILKPSELLGELVAQARSGKLPADMLRPALDLATSLGGEAQLRQIWSLAAYAEWQSSDI